MKIEELKLGDCVIWEEINFFDQGIIKTIKGVVLLSKKPDFVFKIQWENGRSIDYSIGFSDSRLKIDKQYQRNEKLKKLGL